MIDNNDADNTNIVSLNLCPSSFDATWNNATKNALNISHVNIRSLPKNIDSLRLLYEYSLQTKFHVIRLSEVWNVSLPQMLGLQGYSLECREAPQRGGGVGAYIHPICTIQGIEFQPCSEACWLSLDWNIISKADLFCWYSIVKSR